jgi:hypothetical protein
MIYCVIPTELADELYDRLVEHYRANPNVQVIVDRRSEDRRAGELEIDEETAERRLTRDRRRARPGTFPALHDPSA